MKRFPIAAAVLATALITIPTLAQDPSQPATTVDDEIVVSANRVETDRDAVGSSVTVIDRDEIERRNKTTVLELLRTVPGVAVAQQGGPGRVASVFLRGGNSSHTLVLVDGVRVNDNSTGLFDFADLSADNLERIEVVRGPQSTLYGSEAVAGVVSIFTRRGAGPASFWADAEAGNEDHRRLRAGVRGGTGAMSYSLSVSDLETDGFSAAREENGNRELDPHQNRTLSGRLDTSFLGDGQLRITSRYQESDTALDGFAFGLGPVDDLNFEQDREAFTTGVSVAKNITRRWRQTVSVGVVDETLTGSDPDSPFNNFDLDTTTTELTAQSDFTLSPSDTLTFGYQVEKREGGNPGNFDESVYLRSVFLQNSWSWQERLFVTAGVRNDDHSVFGDETTYRVTLSMLLPDSGTRFHGTYGTGFRAPSFNELYFPFFGNPDLAPETSEGFDLGVEQRFLDSRLIFDVTYFDTEYENLIGFDLSTFLAGNIARATADGVELGVSWEPSDAWGLLLSHTFTDSENVDTGQQLPRRPEHLTSLQLNLEPSDRLRGNITALAVRDRIDTDGQSLDDYERIDLSLEYRLSRWLRPYLRTENLFDEDYSEVRGYTSPGFTAVVGLRIGTP